MNTNTLKVSLLCAAALCASVTSAQPNDDAPAAAVTFASASFEVRPCAPQELIDRGWEQQLDLLEARLAIKDPSTLRVPGAIITSPFDAAARKNSKAAKANSK